MNELSFSVMCFNVKVQTKNLEIIKYLQKENCDLYFLQEVKSNKIKPKNECSDCYKDELADVYDVIYLKENQTSSTGSHPCSCLFYNKSKFRVIIEDKILYALHEDRYTNDMKPEILKEFEAKLIHGGHDTLKKRASLAILQYKGSDTSGTWSPRIIVVSYHGPYKRTGLSEDDIQNNATQLFTALDYLGQATGCPVLVAGDFNCDLLKMKVNTNGFIVPSYNPTIHRVQKDCIDFFAYKNYAGCTEIEIKDVYADLVIKDDYILKGTDGQYHVDHKYAGSWLKSIDEVSDHDPLRATLIVKHVLPTLTISYYNNINNDQNAVDYLTKVNHSSDLVIFNNINATPMPKLNHYYCNGVEIFESTVLYWRLNLKFLKHDKWGQNIYHLDLCRYDNSNLKISFSFIHKGTDKVNKMLTKMLRTVRRNTVAIVVMGDFNINSTKLPLIVKQCESPLQDECFIAYMNGTSLKTGVVTPFFCSLSVHSTKTIIHNIDKLTGSSIKHVTLPHHQALLNFGIHDLRINVLCFNMEGTNKRNTRLISSYFCNLNPKPDLYILQTTQEIRTEIEEILGIDKLTHNTCCESTIVYNSNFFQLLTELEFVFQAADSNDSQPSSSQSQPGDGSNKSQGIPADNVIMACIFKCLKIAGNPEVVVASFHNFTNNNINNAKRCFNLFCKNYPTHPILIAGGFNVELDTLKNDHDANCGFEVMQYDPTILRVFVQSQRKQNICRDYFAHKSSTEFEIKLEDVHAETIIPCPGIVTGLKNYNIDYDKGVCNLPDVIIEHDPIRAKLTIEPPQELILLLQALSIPGSSAESGLGEHKALSIITSQQH